MFKRGIGLLASNRGQWNYGPSDADKGQPDFYGMNSLFHRVPSHYPSYPLWNDYRHQFMSFRCRSPHTYTHIHTRIVEITNLRNACVRVYMHARCMCNKPRGIAYETQWIPLFRMVSFTFAFNLGHVSYDLIPSSWRSRGRKYRASGKSRTNRKYFSIRVFDRQIEGEKEKLLDVHTTYMHIW